MSAFPAVIAGVLLAGGLAACSAQSTSTPPSGPVTSATSASVVSSPSSAQAGVIPWVNRPARQDNGAMTTPPYTTGARPCTPANLSVRPGSNGATAGTARLQVLFTNRSSTTCWLNGYPTSVAGIAGTGAVTPLAAGHDGPPIDGAPTANIAPGQSAEMDLSAADGCTAVLNGQHRIFLRLQFGLPGAAPGTTTGTVTGSGDGFDTECGLGVSEFGVPADVPVSPAPSPLTATITAPSAARPGSIPPHSQRLLKLVWTSEGCQQKGGSDIIDELILQVRVGILTRTETIPLDPVFALEGTAASQALCSR
jgi:hypothetical protein